MRREPEESIADFRASSRCAKSSRPSGGRASRRASRPRSAAPQRPHPGQRLRGYAAQLAEAGADELLVADTVGYADPSQVRALFGALRDDLGPELPIGAHFHDTRGLGLANVTAALDCGIRSFDASLAGLGGCPFALGATGNIVTEDLVFLLDSMGLRTGVDLEALVAVRAIVERNLPAAELHGALARAGLPVNYVPAA